jgi:hypothetical protein
MQYVLGLMHDGTASNTATIYELELLPGDFE